ncbi:pyruvate formate lyase activating enzyme [Clostridium cavendishii DSM 21758]|uniref:Pyruvate formate lyase activating enzyme n=1 Tax=Clostridium cavendishii DSM 21758 TaxID=1121302 RepID=A0A1M6I1B3_9CLOT|nr:AmmeMemoRadiSam system radical SAM enzyme [Clostridium cavendishii]SHJ28217.1 pyruvate formate lyase activating enzyme [Clostridium cavendishii DSM 21758]
MIKEALYYERKNNMIYCKLCPHRCHLLEGQLGICQVRKAEKHNNNELKLYTLNYGAITSIALDPIEKKPLSKFYPGSYIVSVGSFGCNFKCSFCQNYSISQYKPEYKDINSKELLKLINDTKEEYKNMNIIGLAFTYNEPSIWYEYILQTSKFIKENQPDLKIVLVTNGFINEEPLKELLPYVDAMNIDLKGDAEYYKRLCFGRLEPVLNTIKVAHSQGVHIEISSLLVQDENTSVEIIEEIGDFLSELDKDIPLHISRYFPNYKLSNEATDIVQIRNAYKSLKSKLNNVYVGNVSREDLKKIIK